MWLRQSLATVERLKTFKKRPLRKTVLQLGRDFGINVQLYKMLRKADKGKRFQLHAVTNDELVTESALLDQDTGAHHLQAHWSPHRPAGVSRVSSNHLTQDAHG